MTGFKSGFPIHSDPGLCFVGIVAVAGEDVLLIDSVRGCVFVEDFLIYVDPVAVFVEIIGLGDRGNISVDSIWECAFVEDGVSSVNRAVVFVIVEIVAGAARAGVSIVPMWANVVAAFVFAGVICECKNCALVYNVFCTIDGRKWVIDFISETCNVSKTEN